jgi:transposase
MVQYGPPWFEGCRSEYTIASRIRAWFGPHDGRHAPSVSRSSRRRWFASIRLAMPRLRDTAFRTTASASTSQSVSQPLRRPRRRHSGRVCRFIDTVAHSSADQVLDVWSRHPRWTFHFVPTSCSWLNAVEGFFSKLTRYRLKNGVFYPRRRPPGCHQPIHQGAQSTAKTLRLVRQS